MTRHDEPSREAIFLAAVMTAVKMAAKRQCHDGLSWQFMCQGLKGSKYRWGWMGAFGVEGISVWHDFMKLQQVYTHLVHDSVCPPTSTTQRASRLFLQGSRLWHTNVRRTVALCSYECGDLCPASL